MVCGLTMPDCVGRGSSGTEDLNLGTIPSTNVRVDIEFNNIYLDVSTGFIRKKSKTVLKNVSGLFRSGQLTAIMGPSGAGKTSLMNALTGFSTKGVRGTIRAGDSICELGTNHNTMTNLQSYRKKSCYILQDDRLNPLFTVEELMQFAVDFKLGHMLPKLRNSMITEILDTLGLSGTEDTRCCYLSGGQRKRLSIAVELIGNPPVLFLDEPTTGLDCLTSTQCMSKLKELTRAGKTIICTIHQPTASIYKLFDKVYILAEGMCIYDGPSADTVPYLASLGLQCPKYHNPADYILEIANGEYGKLNDYLATKVSKGHYFSEKPAVESTDETKYSHIKLGTLAHLGSPHELYKFGVLFRRNIIQQYRDWTVTHLKVLLHIAVGILLGLFNQNFGNDGSKTFSNMGYLIVSTVYLCYTSMMPAVLKFPQELPILKKENFNNWYTLKTYYAAVLVTTIPLQILYSIVYSAPSYAISGQPMELSRFVMFVLVLANVTLIADAIGNFIGTCVNPINGTFLGAISTCFMLAFAGFLVLTSHMSVIFQHVSCVSFMKYVFEALALSLYAYNRPPLLCPEDKLYCHMRYPNEIMKQMNFKQDNYWTNIAILVSELIFFRIISFYTLRRKVKKSS